MNLRKTLAVEEQFFFEAKQEKSGSKSSCLVPLFHSFETLTTIVKCGLLWCSSIFYFNIADEESAFYRHRSRGH